MARIAVDPVTRVGGHLRIEADVVGGEVQDAWSSGTMFRGMELLLQGRDPRDAWMFAERICGTCTGVHALASVRAVEQAFGLVVPTNARLIRNLLAATLSVRDHVVQFYLAQVPDWVDAKAAMSADPSATSILAGARSGWPKSSAAYFQGIRDRLNAVISSDQPGLFGSGYDGHPAYRLSPEENLVVLAHGLEALDWQRDLMRIQTLFGGRDPHPQSYLVGGMSLTPPWGGPPAQHGREHPRVPGRDAPAALSDDGLSLVDGLIASAQTFVNQVFLPDVLALARSYPEWTTVGAGPGSFLSYGEFPEDDGTEPALFLPRGRIVSRNLNTVAAVDQAAVEETVAHAWYADDGGDAARHPADGQTNPEYSGPALPLTTLDGAVKYSWLKAPRYGGMPMEVGPLARMLVGYADGQTEIRGTIDAAVTSLGLGPKDLFSTMGRIIGKAVETQVVARRATRWLSQLKGNLARGDVSVVDASSWDPTSWPVTADGWSLGEGPRGAVGHWLSIRDSVISHYQVVDATTWNGSPRDATDGRGPMESALVGTRVSDPSRPLEILRTVHSFDPCTACAVHAFDPSDPGPVQVRIRRRGTVR